MRALGKNKPKLRIFTGGGHRTECRNPESSLVGRRGRFVGFVKLGFYADWTVIDLGGDRKVWYPNGLLAHVMDTARMHVPEALVPIVKKLTYQVTYFPGRRGC